MKVVIELAVRNAEYQVDGKVHKVNNAVCMRVVWPKAFDLHEVEISGKKKATKQISKYIKNHNSDQKSIFIEGKFSRSGRKNKVHFERVIPAKIEVIE